MNILNPPKKLYVMGDETILKGFGISIVGSRKASKYGQDIAKSLAYGLSKKGSNIISGMALGIDTAAHRGALIAKGKTIAVLGSGFNNIYPKENTKLFWEIINSGGAVVSEYEPNMSHRIISGLSHGVIIAEASEKSGSLITADFALEQGKEVFAVPR